MQISFILRLLTLLALLPATSVKAAPSVAREWNLELLESIRETVPNPPQHARNLFHTAVAMYNAWAAYDSAAVGYIYNEKVNPLPADVEVARREAVSYAAHRVLREWFSSHAAFDARLNAQGYSAAIALAPVTNAATPAELGKRIGRATLTWSAGDGFDTVSESLQAYTAAVNPNMNHPMSVMGMNHVFQYDMQVGYGVPPGTDPNFWQPLALSSSTTQNGIITPGGIQTFLGVQGLVTTPFSLKRADDTKPWIDPRGGPSRLSTPQQMELKDYNYKYGALEVVRMSGQLNDETRIDISPASTGNNLLGEDAGSGLSANPLTGQPFAPEMVKRGDFGRVLAEFWADGPRSETPPGHWHLLANEVTDGPQLQKCIRGTGPVVSDLEWDVKLYFCVSAATHDAACAAWALKRYYSGVRPITMIRYMGNKGQSYDEGSPGFDAQGMLLETGVCELITAETVQGKHAQIWDVGFNAYRPGLNFINQIAVYSWPGEHPGNPAPANPPVPATQQCTVRWMLAKDWLPFQRKTFNTPAFPGYISGHSAFSRAAAEALTLYTGSKYFPGGFYSHTIAANSMQIDKGPSEDVELQWCSYFDAADQAGQSRVWGGIHVKEDDYHGREVGSIAGIAAYTLAEKYWRGTVADETIAAEIEMLRGNQVQVKWNATRGMYHKVQTSTALSGWADATSFSATYSTEGEWVDSNPAPGTKFYRIMRSATGP